MFSFAKKLVDRLDGQTSSAGDLRDSYFKNALDINNKGHGLRVLNVKPNSIASERGLESWFDYIIQINCKNLPMKHPLTPWVSYNIGEDGTISYDGDSKDEAAAIDFNALVDNITQAGKEITIHVWNAKGGIIRKVVLPLEEYIAKDPNNSSLENLFENRFAELGLTLQSQHLITATYVWRILSSHPGSPAFKSQLVPSSDYVVGCDSMFSDDKPDKGLLSGGGETLLTKTIQDYYNHHYAISQIDSIPITIYVYNHDYDILRPVVVNLNRKWGGTQNKGILGCDVGYGLLHRLPEVVGKFTNEALNDDILFESNATVSYNPTDTPSSVVSDSSRTETSSFVQEPSQKLPLRESAAALAISIMMQPYIVPEESGTSSQPQTSVSPPRVSSALELHKQQETVKTKEQDRTFEITNTPLSSVEKHVSVSNIPTVNSEHSAIAPPPIFPPSNKAMPAISLPHRSTNRRKKHATGSLNVINDLVNAELANSKRLDVQYNSTEPENTASAPPPPRTK
ncbi:uncharacterized protein PRCAT00003927001 [Priceomyces carsonii]|uniref:uncharacterized protein n=1 Tax=Priceomyces carsonii TaxID=28549 RepID=UPI002EDA66C0|nr:unnamed protein product [Priceomyces carsonii]